MAHSSVVALLDRTIGLILRLQPRRNCGGRGWSTHGGICSGVISWKMKRSVGIKAAAKIDKSQILSLRQMSQRLRKAGGPEEIPLECENPSA